MKSTKKVRSQAKPKDGLKKETSKTKTQIKKTPAEECLKKVEKKSKQAQIGKKTLKTLKRGATTPQTASDTSAKTKKLSKQTIVKRKKRELTKVEYDAFVAKAAKKEQVRPEELVTIDRRTATPPATPKSTGKKDADNKDAVSKTARPKVQRRRQIDPTTCERDYTQEEIEFMNALDEYKRNSGRMFPTCSEILEVFRGLGYIRQSHEESVEVNTNPETGNIYVISKETTAMSREEIQAHSAEIGSEWLLPMNSEENDDYVPSFYQGYPIPSSSGNTPFFL